MWLWRRAGRAGSGARRLRGSLATVLGPNWGFVTRAEFVTDGGMARKMIYTK